MQILCVDPNAHDARARYEQFLSYRGVTWEMVHARTVREAADWLQRDLFDVVLLTVPADHEQTDLHTGFIRRASYTVPVVVLAESRLLADHRELVRQGAEDCLHIDSVDGDFIMRRMRMAVSRFHHHGVPVESEQERSCVVPANGAVEQGLTASLETPVPPVASPSAGQAVIEGETAHSVPRILMVEDESTIRPFGTNLNTVAVVRADSLGAAVDFLDLQTDKLADEDQAASACQIDAVVIDQELLERDGPRRLADLRAAAASSPIVALAADRSDRTAVRYVESGMDDCLIAVNTNWKRLEQTIQLCVLRRTWRQTREAPSSPDLPANDRRSQPRGDSDRRESSRYMVSRPILAIPVLPNGAADDSDLGDAFTLDVSTQGVSFHVTTQAVVPSHHWVLGFAADSMQPYEYEFVSALVKNVKTVDGGLRIGAQFSHPEDDLFCFNNRMPRLSSETYQMTTEFPDRVLRSWEGLGVLQRVLLNRMKSCPECAAVAVVSDGCRDCGSSVVEFRELIHHFACAHVGDAETFQGGNGIDCPKCLMKRLVAGADFEVIKAQYQCACGYSGSRLEQVGTCLNCHLHFPLRMASDVEVYGYHVDAVDILAYLSTTT